jgi:CRP/FNR family transcriptional regulator
MLAAIDNIVFNSMEERLKIYLKDKVFISKSKFLHISHYEIANDLHSSRVVISRLMKKLEKEGIIKQTRNKVEYLKDL